MQMVLQNFFTHKDFLPPPESWPGTLFSPLQIVFCLLVAAFIVYASLRCAKKSETYRKIVYFVLWLLMLLSEPAIAWYDTCAGSEVFLDLTNVLPFWSCSIFLYTLPFALWGKGRVRKAACGYLCTLGLFGGAINFVYPATYISRYSCISLAGFRTIFYHGSMVFTGLTMLLSGEHDFRNVTRWEQLVLPFFPALCVSIPAAIANALVPGADYMFLRLRSFFFAPLGEALPGWLCPIVALFCYFIIHAAPYLPSYIAHLRKGQTNISPAS